tara:strand:- start:234 stop:1250 length:1017 start_codon:yes stop_codon:yes gene_type:complete
MQNIKKIISSLDNHKMFKLIEAKSIKKLIKNHRIIGYRNDGIGSRLMTYVNLVRLSKKFNCKFIFYWDTRSDKNSPSYPHSLSTNINNYLPNLKNIKFYNSKNSKINNFSLQEWKIIVCKGEKKQRVLKECSEIANKIFKNNSSKIKKNNIIYKYGLHLRLGDINAFTRRNYSKNKLISHRENFNLGKWYPSNFWIEICKKIDSKILVASSDYRETTKIFKNFNNIKYCNKLVHKKENETYKFIFDIVSISQTKNAICSLASGSGLIICLLSKNNVFTPEAFLKIENIFFDFYEIILINYYKVNTMKSLIRHNIRYFLSKVFDFKLDFLSELFKRSNN